MLHKCLLIIAFSAFTTVAFGHDPGTSHIPLREWHLKNHSHLHGSFLMMKNDRVVLETESGASQAIALSDFSDEDQQFIQSKIAQIEMLNKPENRPERVLNLRRKPASKGDIGLFIWVFFALAGVAGFLFMAKKKKPALAVIAGSVLLFAFRREIVEKMLNTDPLFMDAAFEPFKPEVATHWDATWFYVESQGIPTTHPMMTGITKWQQQVPIPQCYIGANAWQIPLNPVLAATPVPVNQQHFLRGAVAIAANGIPIFNPYTNTGVDAFLDGQLDQWGGHCGRADDYHYHIAPMFLDTQTVDILPIAFALDGFAVYGNLEPEGAAMLPLDDNHGHFDTQGVYHYHGTSAAPYMIGNMVGQVTEDNTMQIIPQAHATPVRPSLTPLNGAVITGCVPNPAGNGYTLTYTRNGQAYQVQYNWTSGGIYTYNFTGPAGTTTETYNGFIPCEVPTATWEYLNESIRISVAPNPNSGSFILEIKDLDPQEHAQVSIFNAGGTLVYQNAHAGSALEIGGLPKGVYLVKVQIGKDETTRKIIVQ